MKTNFAKALLGLFAVGICATLTFCIEAAYGDVKSDGPKTNLGKLSDEDEKMVELLQKLPVIEHIIHHHPRRFTRKQANFSENKR